MKFWTSRGCSLCHYQCCHLFFKFFYATLGSHAMKHKNHNYLNWIIDLYYDLFCLHIFGFRFLNRNANFQSDSFTHKCYIYNFYFGCFVGRCVLGLRISNIWVKLLVWCWFQFTKYEVWDVCGAKFTYMFKWFRWNILMSNYLFSGSNLPSWFSGCNLQS